MVAILLTFGVYLIFPVVLILGLSFNTNAEFFSRDRIWGIDHWQIAFTEPRIAQALWNTVWLWLVTMAVSFPLGIMVACLREPVSQEATSWKCSTG